MIATKITMPVTPYRTPQEVVARLKELGAPQPVVDRAEYQEYVRTDQVRELFTTAHTGVEWLEYAHTFENEQEIMYLKGRPNRTKGVERVLARLKERGVITGYEQVSL